MRQHGRRVRRTRPRAQDEPAADSRQGSAGAAAQTMGTSAWLVTRDAARPGFGMVTAGAGGAPNGTPDMEPEDRERPTAGTPAGPTPAPTMTADTGAKPEAPVPADAEPEPLAPITGTAEPVELEAYGNGGAASVQLRGVTRASFRSSFRTEDATTTPATGCTRCPPGQCVHATGTLVADYDVTTRVSLPAVPRGLTECQRQRVRDAIDNVLAPHEQQHVQEFETFRGTTSRPFDLTVCRNKVNAEVKRLFEAERAPRQAAAQAASDALDPFQVDVDLDCDRRTSQAEQAPGPGHEMPDGEEQA